LGNGTFYRTGNEGSATPVPVSGGGGTGTLTGVASLASTGAKTFCALLTSGGVDCWGYGLDGELGNGTFYTTGDDGSASPVQVAGVGGVGTLGGVQALASDSNGFCALLTSGGVDCWGDGEYGELGDGTFHTTSPFGSATPVQVEGVGGSGTLGNVQSLSSDGIGSYCVVLTSGTVDCWGYGRFGELGNGTFYTTGNGGSASPVQVTGVSGSGTLGGVASLTAAGDSYCALLTSTGADCWGYGFYGELGDGTFYTTGNDGSAIPVQVVGVGGTGTLTGAASLDSDGNGYCAGLSSQAADCWGNGDNGQLGDGTFYTTGNQGSASPVQVEGVGGTGTLAGVATLGGDLGTYCADLASSGVDCWGYGFYGELGNGTFYSTSPDGSATPVTAVGVGGSGTLSGITALKGDGAETYCGLLSSGGVDCWGNGFRGELGNGVFYTTTPLGSADPVQVLG
ncbi:MAG: hypothetical protein JO368_09415, partial [Acidimicrobiales bacterium]|nr:hypothetical protein [Acidimicrobiales bacterium]